MDIPEILKLWKELEDFHHELDSFFTLRKNAKENFQNFLFELIKSNASCVFVAIEKDQIVGFISGKIEQYPPLYLNDKYGAIYDTIVNYKYRRKGIGESLLKEIINWFKSKEITRMEVGVASNNPLGYPFWKKYGFKDYIHKMALDIK